MTTAKGKRQGDLSDISCNDERNVAGPGSAPQCPPQGPRNGQFTVGAHLRPVLRGRWGVIPTGNVDVLGFVLIRHLSLAERSGQPYRVRLYNRHKSSATHSYQCMQYFVCPCSVIWLPLFRFFI